MVFAYPRKRLNPLLFASAGVMPPSTIAVGQFLWWKRDGTAPLATAECQKQGVLLQVTEVLYRKFIANTTPIPCATAVRSVGTKKVNVIV